MVHKGCWFLQRVMKNKELLKSLSLIFGALYSPLLRFLSAYKVSTFPAALTKHSSVSALGLSGGICYWPGGPGAIDPSRAASTDLSGSHSRVTNGNSRGRGREAKGGAGGWVALLDGWNSMSWECTWLGTAGKVEYTRALEQPRWV